MSGKGWLKCGVKFKTSPNMGWAFTRLQTHGTGLESVFHSVYKAIDKMSNKS